MLRSFYRVTPDEADRSGRDCDLLMAVIDRVLYISMAGFALCLILIVFE
jgi:hypothetical protein